MTPLSQSAAIVLHSTAVGEVEAFTYLTALTQEI